MAIVDYNNPNDKPPVDYDQSRVPQEIKDRSDGVRHAKYGSQNKEFLAQNAEIAGIYAGEAKRIAEQTQYRQDAVEDFNNQVIQEMTDKDVISAPEIIQARDGEQTLQNRLNRDHADISTSVSHNKIYTNALSLGCKPNDPNFDNAPLIQAEIDRLTDLGGGTIFFPVGVYYVKSSLLLRNNVRLLGANRGRRDSTSKGSVIQSNASVTCNLIEIDGRGEYDNYTYSTSIENIQLCGNSSTDYVLSQISSAYTIIKNVIIRGGNNGLYCLGTMLDVWDNIAICDIRYKSIYVDNKWSKNTTMRFYNTYIGQSPYASAIPLKIESYSTVDITFYSPTFETIPNGCEIGQAVIVNMVGVYCENFPSSGNKTAFRFGMLNPTDNLQNIAQRGTYKIDGLFYQGAISGWETNTLFKFDNHKMFSCNNGYARNIGTVLSYDEIDKSNFNLTDWCSENGLVINDIDKIDKSRLTAINCQYGNNITLNNSPIKHLNVPLINDWFNLGEGHQEYSVFAEDNNFINIVGVIKGGNSTLIANIPAPYRPKNNVTTTALQVTSSVWTPTSASVNNLGEVRIGTSDTANKSFNIRYRY